MLVQIADTASATGKCRLGDCTEHTQKEHKEARESANMEKTERVSLEIQKTAETYKRRAQRSPRDDKRHDRVHNDEAVAMLKLDEKYHLTAPKLAAEFDRSVRAVKTALQRAIEIDSKRQRSRKSRLFSIEEVIKIAPGRCQFFDIDLPNDMIYIETVKVVPREWCGFQFRIYDSLRFLKLKNDACGDDLRRYLFMERAPNSERASIQERSPELYVDKDRSRKLHCEIAYVDPPIRFDMDNKELRDYQKRDMDFVVKLIGRPA